jgi:hypothetical protein
MNVSGETRPRDFRRSATARPAGAFCDLRATGITWELLAGTDMKVLMQRAGHEEPKTTLLYIREAESVGKVVGEPFPALPESLTTAPDKGLSGSGTSGQASKKPDSKRPQRDSNPCYSLERAVSWA